VLTRLPAFVPVRGQLVTLRPLAEDEFSQVWAASPAGRDSRAAGRLRQRIRRSGRLARGMLDLAIDREGRLIGDVQARHPAHAIPAGVFELGIRLYQPEDHGKGYGTDAVQLLTGWLFERVRAERVQAGTAMTNLAMRRVLERLGFTLEGVMRGFMAGPAGRQDFALYGVTRADWQTGEHPCVVVP
jgi:[ribosomal protein S5]-alanine N-acetyltransferase